MLQGRQESRGLRELLLQVRHLRPEQGEPRLDRGKGEQGSPERVVQSGEVQEAQRQGQEGQEPRVEPRENILDARKISQDPS
jgi:hypothetical protein